MDERVNVVVRAFQETVRDLNVELFFFILFLFVVFFALLFFYDNLKMKMQELKLKRTFFNYAKDSGLTEEEAELLWVYSKKLGRDPFLVLEFKSPFEKVINLYIQENPNFDESLIKSIRHKLGFDRLPPFVPLSSTKDIDLFQDGYLFYGNKKFPVVLYDKDELFQYWMIVDAEPPFPFRKGDKVKIKFLRKNDGFYSYEAEIEDIIIDKHRVLVKLPHIFKTERLNRRENYRIDVNIPVDIKVENDETGEVREFKGEIRDISLDGTKFCIKNENQDENQLKIGEIVNLSFEIKGKNVSINAEIKNIKKEKKYICYGSEFIDIDKVKQVITEFINEQQKKLLEKYKKFYGNG